MTRKRVYKCRECSMTATVKQQILEHSCTERLLQVSTDGGQNYRPYDPTIDWHRKRGA